MKEANMETFQSGWLKNYVLSDKTTEIKLKIDHFGHFVFVKY